MFIVNLMILIGILNTDTFCIKLVKVRVWLDFSSVLELYSFCSDESII